MIVKIAFRNIIAKPLNTLLSVLLITSSVGIISLMLLLQDKVTNHLDRSIKNVDLVMGAKGSPLQLILSAVYQMDAPTGNIPYSEAQKWMKHPFIQKAIPLAYGDNFKNYKIVGTTTDYLNLYHAKIEQGRVFSTDFEVVLGCQVAQAHHLKIGDFFSGVHGDSEHGEVHENKKYRVVGILKPSNTVLDQLIVCSIPSIWQTHDTHESHETHEEETHHHESEKEITAVLLQIRNKMGFVLLPRLVSKNTTMQIASPAIETNRLFSLLGFGVQTITGIAYGIMAIAAISIFILLLTTIREKRYEFALLRTLGASQIQLFTLVLFQSMFVAIIGFVLGLLLSRLGLYLLIYLESDYNIATDGLPTLLWHQEGVLLSLTFLIALIAALLPAFKAYRLSISKTLAHA